MIGMSFLSFFVLLVLSLIAAGVLHYLLRYRFFQGIDGFVGKWIAGWIGAWLGSPVLGHWFGRFAIARINNIYIIPALIGAFVGAFITTAYWKVLSMALSHKHE
jgi:uncharacterized membrane protein YeaQ/YmgE (transglycosylase-associated protein family)